VVTGTGAAELAGSVAEVAGAVPDPEIPVVTIADLGILRGVAVSEGKVVVTITPTYSGCPAMDAIRHDIARECARHGWHGVEVATVLSPPWTTDWITAEGRRKLAEFGIAPPAPREAGGPVPVALSVRCPRCGSTRTRETSRFGSTACKALYVCQACLEPFDYFKTL
jgi:ring-1,2-phenylacetyl-CoA epoxidase subunit PaaD